MTTRPPALPGTDDIPDDSARLAKEMVKKLTAAVEREPTYYNRMCLRGWLAELANPTKYKGDAEAGTVELPVYIEKETRR